MRTAAEAAAAKLDAAGDTCCCPQEPQPAGPNVARSFDLEPVALAVLPEGVPRVLKMRNKRTKATQQTPDDEGDENVAGARVEYEGGQTSPRSAEHFLGKRYRHVTPMDPASMRA
jgi:hypothetical protein